MIGVALEGGGARGAYHVGAMKALYEDGHPIDGYVGTSIGAINGALLAQGDFDGLERLWAGISPEQLFSEPVARLLQLGERSLTDGFTVDLSKSLAELLHGVDTSRMRAVIGALLDERKLRARRVDFGLVTVRARGLKARELRLPDIPDGQLLDHLMASASFPGFKPTVIGQDSYLDGGLANNCPINMLTDAGYERVFAIRTLGPGVFRTPKTDAEVTVIAPSRDLGNVMQFDNGLVRRNMRLGYLDARRVLHGGLGGQYYVLADGAPDCGRLLMALDQAGIEHLRSLFPLPDLPPLRLLFERILPELGAHLKLGKAFSYEELTLALLEFSAQALGVDELAEYTWADLAGQILRADSAPNAPGNPYVPGILHLARQIAQGIRTEA